MKKICFLLFLYAFHVQGGIESYLKPVYGKESCHMNPIEGVDLAYVINLDQRPEKFAHCQDELSSYGIIPYRFSAVNGWELNLDAINEIGVKYKAGMTEGLRGTCYLFENAFKPLHEIMHVPERTYFCHCMTRGAIGIVLSHLSVLQDAYNSGYNTIWVMEDDIEVIQNPHSLSELIYKLDLLVGKNGWDILFTDQDTKGRKGEYIPCLSYAKRPNFTPKNPQKFAIRSTISPDFKKIGARYGAYSMIVRRSGMEKLLQFFKKYNIFLPFDMEYTLPNDIKLYTLIQDVVSTQPCALSDNGAPNYKLNLIGGTL